MYLFLAHDIVCWAQLGSAELRLPGWILISYAQLCSAFVSDSGAQAAGVTSMWAMFS